VQARTDRWLTVLFRVADQHGEVCSAPVAVAGPPGGTTRIRCPVHGTIWRDSSTALPDST
jgi:hypothetical protein